MGNKLGRRRRLVDEKYTRPQGLYNQKDIDQKKLRKLIRKSKLAPCYPGEEECTHDLEECPICFLFYPSLNRSKCCLKSICTECFLQMKVPNSTRPAQCPFCKMEKYAVEYRGRKTKEEKGLEQMEEQRVIEAKIRIRQQELQDDEERMHKRQEKSSSGGNVAPAAVEYSSNAATTASVSVVEDEKTVSSQDSFVTPVIRAPPAPWTNRDSEFLFDLDLEDIMVMEATWLSIQESGRLWNISYPDSPSRQYMPHDRNVPSPVGLQSGSSSSPSGGLAFAVAALAERQQMTEESSMSSTNGNISSFNTLQGASMSTDNIDVVSPDGTLAMTRSHGEWDKDHGPETAESATHYADSAAAVDGGSLSSLPESDDIEGSLEIATDPVIPESFEEQMMLAMAISLAEARALSSE